MCFFFQIFQARNLIDALGKAASGGSPDQTNWRGIIASTLVSNPSSVDNVSGVFHDQIIWRFTWKDIRARETSCHHHPYGPAWSWSCLEVPKGSIRSTKVLMDHRPSLRLLWWSAINVDDTLNIVGHHQVMFLPVFAFVLSDVGDEQFHQTSYNRERYCSAASRRHFIVVTTILLSTIVDSLCVDLR